MSLMPRHAPLTLLVAVATTPALLWAGCGGDPEPIRARTADRLQEDLDKVAQSIAAGRCGPVNAQLERLDRDIDGLPGEVDREVQQALEDGAARLRDLAEQECERLAAERQGETQPETTTTTTTTPTTTTPETTEEQPTEPDEGDEGESPPATTTPEPGPTPAPAPAPAPGGEGGNGGSEGAP
jgi:TolA-binding protein